ncbi:hypothetical protein BJY52DRAFT_1227198 [Lactarius psammicola]|nr:hypothetical protein BJY52DRAFT_1227198 [Lactarius psammicola]
MAGAMQHYQDAAAVLVCHHDIYVWSEASRSLAPPNVLTSESLRPLLLGSDWENAKTWTEYSSTINVGTDVIFTDGILHMCGQRCMHTLVRRLKRAPRMMERGKSSDLGYSEGIRTSPDSL